MLQLYISLTYGDPNDSPSLPFTFAKAYGFFPEVINAIEQEAEEEIRREKEALKKQELERCMRREIGGIEAFERMVEKARASSWQDFSYPMVYQQPGGKRESRQPINFERAGVGSVPSCFLKEYKQIYRNSHIMTLLSPYTTARFAYPWVKPFPLYRMTRFDLPEVIRLERELTRFNLRSKRFWDTKKEPQIDPRFREEAYSESPLKARYELDYLDEVEQLVRKDEEGALVILALLMTLEKPLRWRQFNISGSLLDRLNMMHLPVLASREPFEVFLLLSKLDELIPDYKHEFTRKINNWEDPIERCIHEFEGVRLSVLLSQSHDAQVEQEWWKNSAKPVRMYLMGRAYHIALNGESIANQTFPHPTLPGISSDKVANMVSFMVHLLQEHKERKETQQLQWYLNEHEKKIQEEIDKKYIGKMLPIPTHLPSRAFSLAEREAIRQACLTELVQNGHAGVIQVISDFVQFCELLTRPENHVRTRSSQFVETEVNVYPTQEMINQMSKEITRLPPFQAYTKFIDISQNEVSIHRIKTNPLPKITNTYMVDQAMANGHTLGKDHDAIEEEIRERQNRWLRGASSPPQTQRRRE